MQIFALRPLVFVVPGPLAIYRLHGGSLTMDRRELARGFDLALRKQLDAFRHDPTMFERLTVKRAQTRRAYRRSVPAAARRRLRSLISKLGRHVEEPS
jgi:hypothetical protein